MVLSSCQYLKAENSTSNVSSKKITSLESSSSSGASSNIAPSQDSSSSSNTSSKENTTNDAIMKAKTPPKLYSNCQVTEIDFFKSRNYNILVSKVLNNDTILYGYSQDTDKSTVNFGLYNISQNGFSTLDYKVRLKQNDQISFEQETQNCNYILHGNTVDVLDKGFNKINEFGIKENCNWPNNIVSPDDKYAVDTKNDYKNKKYQVYLIDINNKSSKMIYSLTLRKEDQVGEFDITSACFINDSDIMVRSGPLGFGDAEGVVIDTNGNVIRELQDYTDIDFQANGKYLCYKDWTDAPLSEGELGIYDLEKDKYSVMIKEPNKTYFMLDFKNNLLLYVEDDQKSNDIVSLKTYNIETKTKSTILQNYTNFNDFNDSCTNEKYVISQDGKLIYYINEYNVDSDSASNDNKISYLFTKKIS